MEKIYREKIYIVEKSNAKMYTEKNIIDMVKKKRQFTKKTEKNRKKISGKKQRQKI